MDIAVLALRLFHVEIRRLLLIISLVVSFLLVSQCFALPYVKTFYFSPAKKDSTSIVVDNVANSNNLESEKFYVVDGLAFDGDASELEEEAGYENEFKQIDAIYKLAPDTDSNSHKELMFDNIKSVGSRAQTGAHRSIDNIPTMEKATDSLAKTIKITDNHDIDNASKTSLSSISSEARNKAGTVSSVSQGVFMKGMRNLNTESVGNDKNTIERRNEEKETELLQFDLPTLNDNLTAASISMSMRWAKQATTISEMNSLLLQSPLSSNSMRPQVSSVRDRELLSAKLEIENAPVIRNSPGLAASVFRNVSMFKRSYELMECILKVYVYKEGEKPVFHNPRMRGIYASEGWFMKLMEGNKKFVVKDPKKAHLFYLPFSSQMLRIALSGQNYNGMKDLEKYLKSYVELIAGKYRFWNRTGGADHFLVACHDWASQITRQYMRNCIRALCNANIGKGFKLRKDTTLPVTYIRSMMDPLKDVGGKPASERSILAFFAGSLHGYLRPFLLHYWENKEEDMKIFGPMSRDIEGKRLYREYMKSSKYCICARGYEVHTPRVVESIFYECVPVIISDNFVPPFFEVLKWEEFAVFIQEKDVPNLRNILLSIPQKKYVAMHSRVKMVQHHFFWHKNPVKYDLFHMILHSIWYNRVNQVRTK